MIRRATKEDKELVVNILAVSFQNDPHMCWLLEKSKNPNKLRITLNYVFEETIQIGEIYINDENSAVALWNTEKVEKVTFNFLLRNIRFFFEVGFAATQHILRMDIKVHRHYPKKQKYYHLYLIGVLPEAQGKGFASQLMNPILVEMEKKEIPVYLETANETNINIYEKKGFEIVNIFEEHLHKLVLMRRVKTQA
ncbi:MAG: GNAT family N-acetyltransferase [Prolixibacteraceae bacterium]